ncbi:hypothetical protein Ciccas_010762 [Cichlidogyrus casuarinus]|uniref:Uncharacterized protein n=1 Tax=Cichlidogyrus casuarinus TaxID=1844966 RepID=A0ABD2PT81_9PLAT
MSESTTGTIPPASSNPLYMGRAEILLLLEQLCIRRPEDMAKVLPELVEVCIACADKTKLKERGLMHVCPALSKFSSVSSNSKIQKACAASTNGALIFYDFKIGRYLSVPEHKEPISALKFSTDGRSLASYSVNEGQIRIWQISTTGLFGMGGQQVKLSGTFPVPPLAKPPGRGPETKSLDDSKPNQVWLDWPEPKVVQLFTQSGITRQINIG